MTDHARPFDTGRVRPLVTTLDTLRTPIDDDSFDAVILSLDAVAADLGYGDVHPAHRPARSHGSTASALPASASS